MFACVGLQIEWHCSDIFNASIFIFPQNPLWCATSSAYCWILTDTQLRELEYLNFRGYCVMSVCSHVITFWQDGMTSTSGLDNPKRAFLAFIVAKVKGNFTPPKRRQLLTSTKDVSLLWRHSHVNFYFLRAAPFVLVDDEIYVCLQISYLCDRASLIQ